MNFGATSYHSLRLGHTLRQPHVDETHKNAAADGRTGLPVKLQFHRQTPASTYGMSAVDCPRLCLHMYLQEDPWQKSEADAGISATGVQQMCWQTFSVVWTEHVKGKYCCGHLHWM